MIYLLTVLVRVMHRCMRYHNVTRSLGILMSAGGSKLAWWLDPTGAIIVSNTHSAEISNLINNRSLVAS